MKAYKKNQIRRGLANYHYLDHAENLSGMEGTKKFMNKIRTIQYDPLNVVGRNADLVLQARIEEYSPQLLEQLLYKEHFLVDGYDKEMSIYIAEDFEKFGYVRQAALKNVEYTLRRRGQEEALDILSEVIEFIRENGVTGTKDISIGEVRKSRWGHRKLSSAALDYLYTKGDLVVANKHGTQKHFDLTERILSKVYCSEYESMTIEEFLDWYVKRRITSVGLLWERRGGAWQGAYIYDNIIRKQTIERLIEKGELEILTIEGLKEKFYCNKDFLSSIETDRKQDYCRFIAPLDNILWDRLMTEAIYDFTYRWEVYTPVSKRQFGYYVLPVLYNDVFVGRFEAFPVKEAKSFKIKKWWWEDGVHVSQGMIDTIYGEMERFAKYLKVNLHNQNIRKMEDD